MEINFFEITLYGNLENGDSSGKHSGHEGSIIVLMQPTKHVILLVILQSLYHTAHKHCKTAITLFDR